MLILLSPTKKQLVPDIIFETSKPAFLTNANEIITELKKLDYNKIKSLFKVSDSIADINLKRFSNWENLPEGPALYTFTGEAFNNLDPKSLDKKSVSFLNDNLVILSGLYGALKPLDSIKNYRLDIADKLKINSDTLYKYWYDKINSYLMKRVATDSFVLNLASDEYTKGLDFKSFNCPVITPKFLVEKDGKLKSVAIWAKKMRGSLAREVAINNVNTIPELKKITLQGFTKEEDDFIYIRRDS